MVEIEIAIGIVVAVAVAVYQIQMVPADLKLMEVQGLQMYRYELAS